MPGIRHGDRGLMPNAKIAIAFKDASGALLTARLINESDLEAVAADMAEVWEAVTNN